MRIDRLDLLAFGAFTDKTLDFHQGQPGLHCIYGHNEAGKSTSLRALTAWLFGIPFQTKDSFLHTNPQLRIGGRLRRSDGKILDFLRRKGNKKTLLSPSGEPLADTVLQDFLPQGMDESLFTRLWGIDHAGLVAGGQDLLAESGDLGQALLSAAMGTANLREVLDSLQQEAETIFRPRASTCLLNQHVNLLKEAQRQEKATCLPVQEWKELQAKLQACTEEIARVEQDIEACIRKKSRLDRMGRVMHVLAERRTVRSQITALEAGVVRHLPEDFADQCRHAEQTRRTGLEQQQRAKHRLALLEKERHGLQVREDILDKEDVILRLFKQQGAVEKTLHDRPQQDGKRRLLRNKALTQLKSVHPDKGRKDLENADILRPALNNADLIARLAKEQSLLMQKKNTAEGRLRELSQKQENLHQSLTGMRSLSPLQEVKAGIAAVRKRGDLEAHLVEIVHQAQKEQRACEQGLMRLGRFTGTLQSFMLLALPERETLDRFEQEEDQSQEILNQFKHHSQEVKQKIQKKKQALEALLQTTDIPTLAELDTLRTLRNRGWHLLRQHYIVGQNQEPALEDFISQAGQLGLQTRKTRKGQGTVAIYEELVERADLLADHLRLASDQVVKRADLETALDQLHAEQRDVQQAEQEARLSQEKVHQQWQKIWHPLGIQAGTPREMKQWLLRVEQLGQRIQNLEELREKEDKQRQLCEENRHTVVSLLSSFTDLQVQDTMSLEALLSLGEQCIQREEVLAEEKRQAQHALEQCTGELQRTKDSLQDVTLQLETWSQNWTAAIRDLGLGLDVHPDYALAACRQLAEFFTLYDQSEDLRRRLYGMDKHIEDFFAQVVDVALPLGYAVEKLDHISLAARMYEDLTKARDARAGLEKIEKAISAHQEELYDAQALLVSAEAQLADLCRLAQVKNSEALAEAGERFRSLHELEKNLARLERELYNAGDGLDINQLEEEAQGMERDAVPVELENINQKLQALQAQRDTLRDRHQTVRNEIAARDGRADAAHAASEAQDHLAGVMHHAQDYLRLQIAALMLEQRIEEYRKENQAPILTRAGDLFSRLTLGSYVGLRDELNNKGKVVLLGLRSTHQEVNVEGMSEGSRDQLYLALRLATLEQHLAHGEPMPFIVDDILMGFDDQRTLVALRVLAELATKTQVLLFTHHNRVVDLGRSIQSEADIIMHSLT